MNSKALILVALVLIAGVVGVGLLLSDSDDSGIAYHGNGQDDRKDIVYSDSTTAAPCSFSKDGMMFYKWNTKSDHSGDFYSVGDTLPESVTDLYAVWTYYLKGNNDCLWEEGQEVKAILINEDSYIEDQNLLEVAKDQYLDPSKDKAIMHFIFVDPVSDWSYDSMNKVVVGQSDSHRYTIGLSPDDNSSIYYVTQQDDGSVKVQFHYEASTKIDLTINVASL